jgi:hypothetical protein
MERELLGLRGRIIARHGCSLALANRVRQQNSESDCDSLPHSSTFALVVVNGGYERCLSLLTCTNHGRDENHLELQRPQPTFAYSLVDGFHLV